MKNKLSDHPLLREQEVAKRFGISVKTLQYDRQRCRGLPYFKIGKAVRYSLEDITDYIAAHRIVPVV